MSAIRIGAAVSQAGAQLARQRVAVHHGQADVENRDLRAEEVRHRQRLRGVAGDLHLVTGLRDDVGDHLRGVAVVVDDEDAPGAVARDPPRGRIRRRASAGGRRAAGSRTVNSLPRPAPVAVRADRTSVQGGERSHERQPEPEPTLRAIGAARALHEHLEQVRQEVGSMPMPLSRTRSTTSSPSRAAVDLDAAARRRVAARRW